MSFRFDPAAATEPAPKGTRGPIAFSSRNARARIVATARILLAQRPTTRLTVQDVADAAGLSRRAVYNYFESAEALYRVAWTDMVRELGDLVPTHIASDLAPEVAIFQIVANAAKLFLSDTNLDLLSFINRAGGDDDGLVASYLRNVRHPIVRAIETYLLHRRVRGEFTATDASAAAEQLVGMIEAATVTKSIFKLREPRQPISDDDIRFVVSGFLRAHFGAVQAAEAPAGPYVAAG